MSDLEIKIGAGGVATVMFNRPDALNAITNDMVDTLNAELPALGRDSAVKVVVLQAEGRAFSAGGDVKKMKGSASPLSFEERVAALRARQEAVIALWQLPKVTIARVQGVAAGMGFGFALACDFRVGGPKASFTTGFVKVGFSGDFGATWLLSRITGPDRAQQLFLSSDKVGAQKAAELGILSHLVEEDALVGTVEKMAEGYAAGAVLAHGYIKANFRQVLMQDFRNSLDTEALHQIRLATTEDHSEALRAFAEKRAPVFSGR